jgi:hypothetical protein
VLFLLAPIVILILLLATNVGDRIAALLYYDQSARERFAVFALFGDIPAANLWLGSSTEDIGALVAGLPDITAIENYWIYLLLQLGILMFVPFTLTLLAFLRWLGRGGTYSALAVLDFLLVSSGNNSLSVKTTAVGALVILVLGAKALSWAAPASAPTNAPGQLRNVRHRRLR